VCEKRESNEERKRRARMMRVRNLLQSCTRTLCRTVRELLAMADEAQKEFKLSVLGMAEVRSPGVPPLHPACSRTPAGGQDLALQRACRQEVREEGAHERQPQAGLCTAAAGAVSRHASKDGHKPSTGPEPTCFSYEVESSAGKLTFRALP
jgi:hypothetical protein